ncbi:Uncharacterised protein g7335 [Pycnogonum litorale]
MQNQNKISMWLQTVYGKTLVPQYENNERTYSLLANLMEKCQEAEINSSVITEDLNRKCLELSAERERIKGILNRLMICTTDLSQSCLHDLRILNSCVLALNLEDASTTSLLIGLNDLNTELIKSSTELFERKKISLSLKQKYKKSINRLTSLKRQQVEAETKAEKQKQELKERHQHINFLHSKEKDYHKKEKSLQQRLSSVDNAVRHQSLVKISEELKQMTREYSSIQAKLNAYQGVPHDIYQAKVKLTEVQMELEHLEAELEKRISEVIKGHQELP